MPEEDASSSSFNLKETRESAEREVVIRALSQVNGKISPAADLLGVSRPTLYDLIQKLNISI